MISALCGALAIVLFIVAMFFGLIGSPFVAGWVMLASALTAFLGVWHR